MYDIKIETFTIKAIRHLLESKFPYAASLLCYALIERILKWKVFREKEQLCFNEGKLKVTYNYEDFTDKDFISKVLCKNALGTIEK